MTWRRELGTDRLWLRRWLPEDLVPFAALNADARVMDYFPAVLSREESDTLASRIEAHFERHDFGLWAVEIADVTSFAGFIGLFVPSFEAPFTPCVEIGWRLAADYWGFRLRHRRRAGGVGLCLQNVKTPRGRFIHFARQPSFSSCNGKDRHGS
jgi:hypothetical protein